MQHQRSRLVLSTFVALAAAAGSARAQQHDTTAATHDTTMQMDMGAIQSADTLKATLTGADEVPGPGDSTATGTATVTLGDGQVCYTLSVSDLDSPTAAHIHKGASGEAGPVVVPLETPKNGSATGCANASADVISGIRANPGDYYVNVHNSAHPKGAIRGQLATHG
jgi:hypothetical protein